MAGLLKNLKLPLPAGAAAKLQELSKKLFQDRHEKELQDLMARQRENPEDARVKHKIGEVFYKQGRVDDAIAIFREIAEQYEKSDFVLKSVEAYKDVLKLKPDSVDVNLKLAQLYARMKMTIEAANQLRIAIHSYARAKEPARALELAQQLAQIDPSPESQAKLAEIYQNNGMTDEAVKQYELLAKDARAKKNYDRLLHYYELILPHRPGNPPIVKDVCILYLRKKQPDRAIHVLDQNGLLNAPEFADIAQKAKLMQDALKRQKKV